MSVLCNYPFISNGRTFGCGQCLPCKVNKRREWKHRIMLEAAQYKDNAFIGLDYKPECEPAGRTVVPKHLTLFIDRVRKAHFRKTGEKVRWYAVGEYGDLSARPHYHIALFNYPTCARGRTDHPRVARTGHCCSSCDFIASHWEFGRCDLGVLEAGSAAYIAGYVTKKMNRKEDPRLCGRHPEFVRMSLKPGIGAGFVPEIASTLLALGIEDMPDVPSSLRHGSSVYPLGRYLRRLLRKHVGRDPNAPQATLKAIQDEMSPVFEEARKIKAKYETLDQAVTRLLDEVNMGKRLQMQARERNYVKKRHI